MIIGVVSERPDQRPASATGGEQGQVVEQHLHRRIQPIAVAQLKCQAFGQIARGVYEAKALPFPGALPSFQLDSAHGDQVYVFPADSDGNLLGYRSGESFGAAANGVSFGRYFSSEGIDFTALSQRTFGAATDIVPADIHFSCY